MYDELLVATDDSEPAISVVEGPLQDWCWSHADRQAASLSRRSTTPAWWYGAQDRPPPPPDALPPA